MKKLKYILFLLLFLLAAVMFSFAACAPGQEEETDRKQPVVTISSPSASLDLYESVQLTATAENTSEAIVWSSSDPSRATVENGLVTAVATGNVHITASAGGASASCSVTITDSLAAPVLSVSDNVVELETGSTFTVTASVMLKGEAVENVQYAWTGGGSAASVTADGAQAEFRGLAAGTEEFYVSATVRGVYVAQKITVTVRTLDIVFDLANCVPGEGGNYAAKLYTFATGGYSDVLTPALTVYEKGVAVADAQVSWESEDSGVVRVENNRDLVAAAEGQTTVVCTYKEASFRVDITVERTRIRLEGSAVAEENDLKPISLSGDIAGTVTDAIFKGVSVFGSFDAAKNELTLSAAKFPKEAEHLGEGEITLKTEKADYILSAALYTMVIHDSDELESMRGIGEGANGYICDGYYILANDIAYTGSSFLPLAPEGVVGRGGSDAIAGITGGFRGVFDGKGYTITGLKFDLSVSSRAYNGMFGVLHRDGVVQNVAFEDASICGALIAYNGSGTVRNIYVHYAAITGGTEGHYAGTVFTGGASVGATVEAVFIDATVGSGTIFNGTSAANTRLIGCGTGSTAVYNGVYIVTDSSLRNAPVTNANGSDAYAGFRTYAAFTSDSSAKNVVAAWDQSIWTTDANGCPVFR